MYRQQLLAALGLLTAGMALAEEVAPDPKAILDRVRADLQGIKAEFIQFEVTETNAQTDLNSGTVWMQAPAQFRWHYQEPYEQLIVADGQNVWVYDEDLEQVTVKGQDNDLNPIYVMINAELAEAHYDIQYETSSHGVDWVSLTPKVKTEDVKQVWMGVKANNIDQIKVMNHFDQTMVFKFTEIQRNPELGADLFQFEVPAGVDLIQAQGQ